MPAVNVFPDDLARVVDAICYAAVGARWIVERGVGAAAVKEAVLRTLLSCSARRSGPRR